MNQMRSNGKIAFSWRSQVQPLTQRYWSSLNFRLLKNLYWYHLFYLFTWFFIWRFVTQPFLVCFTDKMTSLDKEVVRRLKELRESKKMKDVNSSTLKWKGCRRRKGETKINYWRPKNDYLFGLCLDKLSNRAPLELLVMVYNPIGCWMLRAFGIRIGESLDICVVNL